MKDSVRTDSTKRGVDGTRDQLIEAATHLFAKQGFAGTSVKEIADRAGVNVSLVSYHFGGKENLYRECMIPFIETKLDFLKNRMGTPTSLNEFKLRMRIFIENVIEDELKNPDVGCIVRREIETDDPIAMEIFKKSIQKVFETFVAFIKHAQDQNFIRKDIHPRAISAIFMGGIQHCLRTDKLRKKLYNETIADPKIREEFINASLEMFFHGLEHR